MGKLRKLVLILLVLIWGEKGRKKRGKGIKISEKNESMSKVSMVEPVIAWRKIIKISTQKSITDDAFFKRVCRKASLEWCKTTSAMSIETQKMLQNKCGITVDSIDASIVCDWDHAATAIDRHAATARPQNMPRPRSKKNIIHV